MVRKYGYGSHPGARIDFQGSFHESISPRVWVRHRSHGSLKVYGLEISNRFEPFLMLFSIAKLIILLYCTKV